MKPFARAMAVLGLRIETLSPSPKEAPGGLNIRFHSDWSGRGGRSDRKVWFFEVEVEYGERPEVVCRIKTARVDETEFGLWPWREARFNDDLET